MFSLDLGEGRLRGGFLSAHKLLEVGGFIREFDSFLSTYRIARSGHNEFLEEAMVVFDMCQVQNPVDPPDSIPLSCVCKFYNGGNAELFMYDDGGEESAGKRMRWSEAARELLRIVVGWAREEIDRIDKKVKPGIAQLEKKFPKVLTPASMRQ